MLQALASIRDLKVRALALDLRLRADHRAAAHELDQLARRAAHGDGASRDTLLAFAWLRATKEDPALMAALASASSQLSVAEPLFRTTPSARSLAERARLEPSLPAFAHRALATARPDVSYAQHRILVAKVRERVLRDPRASVVARVLDAPIELRDVLRIAARRPSTPDVARAVASSRHLRELPVREALVRNPFTPAWLALVLLPTVRLGVVDLAVAHDEVRAYARLLA